MAMVNGPLMARRPSTDLRVLLPVARWTSFARTLLSQAETFPATHDRGDTGRETA